jgi:hypothetical protein
LKIYTARRALEPREKEAWDFHNRGMAEYHERSFTRAAAHFRDVLKILPGDSSAAMILERCARFADAAPPPQWKGEKVMQAP